MQIALLSSAVSIIACLQIDCMPLFPTGAWKSLEHRWRTHTLQCTLLRSINLHSLRNTAQEGYREFQEMCFGVHEKLRNVQSLLLWNIPHQEPCLQVFTETFYGISLHHSFLGIQSHYSGIGVNFSKEKSETHIGLTLLGLFKSSLGGSSTTRIR